MLLEATPTLTATVPTVTGNVVLVLYGAAGAYLARKRYHSIEDIDSRAASAMKVAVVAMFAAGVALVPVGGFGLGVAFWWPLVATMVACAFVVVVLSWRWVDYDDGGGGSEFEEAEDVA